MAKIIMIGIFFFSFVFSGFAETDHASVFEQFKKLEGTWRGKSTAGWENTEIFRVIGKGSAVLSTSEFVDSPEEALASVIVLYGKQLLLAHYCEARNQSGLKATLVEEGGRKVNFEFAGGKWTALSGPSKTITTSVFNGAGIPVESKAFLNGPPSDSCILKFLRYGKNFSVQLLKSIRFCGSFAGLADCAKKEMLILDFSAARSIAKLENP